MQNERYLRQIILPENGTEGQKKLASAKILVVGAGGLGCPVLQYLCAIGISTLGIIDEDKVQITNLHRQILYSADDIGQKKALIAARKLSAQYPDLIITPIVAKLNSANVETLIEKYDIVVDGSDNLITRYIIDAASKKNKKPWVYAGIEKFEAQVAVFNYNSGQSFEDIFSKEGIKPFLDCNEAGIMGYVPRIVGLLQVNEAVKIILGQGNILSNSILTFEL